MARERGGWCFKTGTGSKKSLKLSSSVGGNWRGLKGVRDLTSGHLKENVAIQGWGGRKSKFLKRPGKEGWLYWAEGTRNVVKG